MGSFERFKTKTHFNSLKRLVGITALAALAVKLLAVALATAAGGGTPLDLLARVPASLADLGAALLVFEVLRSRRPLQLAARSAILVAVSPVLFVASGIHGDPVAVAVALLLLTMYLLVDRDAPLVAGITLALASRVEPMACWPPRWPWPRSPPRAATPPGPARGPGAPGCSTSAGRWPGACWPPGCRPWPGAGTRWPPSRAAAGPAPAASVPAGCWPGRWTTGWPGGWPAPAGRWCWPWPCCRPWSGCADARGGSTPPSAWSCSPPGPGPGVVAAGPGLAGRVRLPGRRPLGQHLRRGRRGHPAVDLDLVGGWPALARRCRPRDRARRHRGRPGPGHLGGARLLAGPGLAHGGGRGGGRGPGKRGPGDRGRGDRGPGHAGGCGQPGAPGHAVG